MRIISSYFGFGKFCSDQILRIQGSVDGSCHASGARVVAVPLEARNTRHPKTINYPERLQNIIKCRNDHLLNCRSYLIAMSGLYILLQFGFDPFSNKIEDLEGRAAFTVYVYPFW